MKNLAIAALYLLCLPVFSEPLQCSTDKTNAKECVEFRERVKKEDARRLATFNAVNTAHPGASTSKAVSSHEGIGWLATSDTEKMSGKKTSRATVTSENSLAFDFPYAGENTGFLTVRQHPKYGLDVIVSIQKGQMLCGYGGCAINVKFDDGPSTRYGANAPADHSSTSLFLDNAQRFISGAKKAKKILIQFSAYREGEPILEFSTPGSLTWPPK